MHLDIKHIIQNPDEFDKVMRNRGENVKAQEVIELYNDWKNSNIDLEEVSARLNAISKAFKPEYRTEANDLAAKKASLQDVVKDKREKLEYVLDRLPNMLDSKVPIGKSADDNIVVEYYGTKSEIENPMHHEDIAIQLGMWSRDEAVHMSGSRFICLTDKLAKLERVLAQFVLDHNAKSGFTELSVPFLIREDALYLAGQLPKFAEAFFRLGSLALIPTGEIPLVNYYADKTLDMHSLPIKMTACTPCFRSEAGSLGRDTKGLTRVHQFQKVELVAITTAEQSEDMHMEMLEHSKSILDALGLHYRVVEICSGDIGFTAARQFDLEVWMPGQNKYVEVASCSNCRDFQARRMKTKYRKDGATHFVHTLNCTAIACGRIVGAILENYCNSGEFNYPTALARYFE
jgi:seryl-tRNA synthetase